MNIETIERMVNHFLGRMMSTNFNFSRDYWIELRTAESDRTDEQRERLAHKLSKEIMDGDRLIQKITGFLATNQYRPDILLGLAVKANQDAKNGRAIPANFYCLKYLILNLLLAVFWREYKLFVSPVNFAKILTAARPTLLVSRDGRDPSCLILNFYIDLRVNVNNAGKITMAEAPPWHSISFHLPRRQISAHTRMLLLKRATSLLARGQGGKLREELARL